MQIALLVEANLLPVPENIKEISNWGSVAIMTNDRGVVRGCHMLFEGSKKDFQKWLGPFDGVWVGKGSPIQQQFEIMHIK